LFVVIYDPFCDRRLPARPPIDAPHPPLCVRPPPTQLITPPFRAPGRRIPQGRSGSRLTSMFSILVLRTECCSPGLNRSVFFQRDSVISFAVEYKTASDRGHALHPHSTIIVMSIIFNATPWLPSPPAFATLASHYLPIPKSPPTLSSGIFQLAVPFENRVLKSDPPPLTGLHFSISSFSFASCNPRHPPSSPLSGNSPPPHPPTFCCAFFLYVSIPTGSRRPVLLPLVKVRYLMLHGSGVFAPLDFLVPS